MQQRTALEQDVIDLARESYDILVKQLELQTQLLEMFKTLTERILIERQALELNLTEIGVNSEPRINGRLFHPKTKSNETFTP